MLWPAVPNARQMCLKALSRILQPARLERAAKRTGVPGQAPVLNQSCGRKDVRAALGRWANPCTCALILLGCNGCGLD